MGTSLKSTIKSNIKGTKMKRINLLIVMVLLSFSFLQATYVGKVYFKSQDGKPISPFFTTQSRHVGLFFDEQIKIGNLRLTKIQNDPIAEMEHHRYSQHYKGLEVFGGQIIKHYKKNEMVGINGEYYRIYDVDITPVISKEEAVEIFRIDLNEADLSEMSKESKLLIYPLTDGDYRLAYQVVLDKGPGYCMTGFIDAKTGEVLLKYSNIQYEDLSIGIGTGYHGAQYKFPTTFYEGLYYLFDEAKTRPVRQYTIDWNLGGEFIARDADNYWDNDGVLINAHVFLGMTYDYYYLVTGRNGINNQNLDIVANVHWPFKTDNAFWDGSKKQMFFCIPFHTNWEPAASIDVIAHEYSHGVTQFASNLIYQNQPGALNESFSDIMGTSAEFYWQPTGSGLNKADWVMGEDMYPFYSPSNYMRSLSNPNIKGDPCHLSQYKFLPNTEKGDWGGVHANMTIFAHAYYLLAEGGTNNVSGKSVTGIGIDKATQIFYRAWVYYLTKTSNFLVAANALLYSAEYLYGKNSEEWQQTIKALEAIGYTFVG